MIADTPCCSACAAGLGDLTAPSAASAFPWKQVTAVSAILAAAWGVVFLMRPKRRRAPRPRSMRKTVKIPRQSMYELGDRESKWDYEQRKR